MIIKIDEVDTICISIMGDTVQTQSNEKLFARGDVEKLVGNEILEILKTSDIQVYNLEAPLTDASELIYKPGAPCIKSSSASIGFFKQLKNLTNSELLISASNNHIKDFGIPGIIDTEKILQRESIPIIGVSSKNSQKAKDSISYVTPKYSVGFYSCAENEFSIAYEEEGGANGYDPLTTFDDIKELSRCNRYTVVLFHAGRENYRYPSINLQRICRKMIDAGANVVVCQHSHCIGCEETYSGGTIVYGQGNFIFDRVNREEWMTSLLIRLLVDEKGILVEYHPIVKDKECVRLAHQEEREGILNAFKHRSKEINDKQLLRQYWEKFCGDNLDVYCFDGVYGIRNKIVRYVDRKAGHRICRWLMRNTYHNLLLMNFIRCESIREALITVLSNNKKDKYNESR